MVGEGCSYGQERGVVRRGRVLGVDIFYEVLCEYVGTRGGDEELDA